MRVPPPPDSPTGLVACTKKSATSHSPLDYSGLQATRTVVVPRRGAVDCLMIGIPSDRKVWASVVTRCGALGETPMISSFTTVPAGIATRTLNWMSAPLSTVTARVRDSLSPPMDAVRRGPGGTGGLPGLRQQPQELRPGPGP